ncbi:WYL domain-containing protein [Albidovulum sp.]|jgi:predicted DNA-binding transcriptional regulator YafY|uniref:WYL domain-containing protein n=1 Tax=Albidovulum sp. TaxID=1872424 RepID=UPI00304E79D0
MSPDETALRMMLSRRALAARLAAGAAAIGIAGRAGAAVPAPDPDLRDAALRGLALADLRGDPVGAAAARAAAARLAEADPEGALLYRLYRKLDVRPSAYWREDEPAARRPDLAALHAAIRACQPVDFGYTDLGGNETERSVLPLALVHPPQGVKLLAWSLEREDFRQFFVRSMRNLAALPGDFSEERMALLEGLVEKEGA